VDNTKENFWRKLDVICRHTGHHPIKGLCLYTIFTNLGKDAHTNKCLHCEVYDISFISDIDLLTEVNKFVKDITWISKRRSNSPLRSHVELALLTPDKAKKRIEAVARSREKNIEHYRAYARKYQRNWYAKNKK